MNIQNTELSRLIANLIRTGTISAVDRENWLCRVKTGDLETGWISWLTTRAGGARTWWTPTAGEQVLLLSLGGNLETAFALPAVYSDDCPPPSDSEAGHIVIYPDGARFEYEPATGHLAITGVKSVTIESADNIALKTSEFVVTADSTQFNSDVIVNGDTFRNGDETAQGATQFRGDVVQTDGVMSSNGVVVDSHMHVEVVSGKDISGGPL